MRLDKFGLRNRNFFSPCKRTSTREIISCGFILGLNFFFFKDRESVGWRLEWDKTDKTKVAKQKQKKTGFPQIIPFPQKSIFHFFISFIIVILYCFRNNISLWEKKNREK